MAQLPRGAHTQTPAASTPSGSSQAREQPAGQAAPLALFVHIPRTGGHSIEDNLLHLATGWSHSCMITTRKGSEVGPDSERRAGSEGVYSCQCPAVSGKLDANFALRVWKQDAVTRCGRLGRTFTMLRNPTKRAVSQRSHFLRVRTDDELVHAARERGVFSSTCEHKAAFCRALSDPTKCRLRGSCGLFQDLQSCFLAGHSKRTLDEQIALSRNDSALAAAAETNLLALDAFGLTDSFATSGVGP